MEDRNDKYVENLIGITIIVLHINIFYLCTFLEIAQQKYSKTHVV